MKKWGSPVIRSWKCTPIFSNASASTDVRKKFQGWRKKQSQYRPWTKQHSRRKSSGVFIYDDFFAALRSAIFSLAFFRKVDSLPVLTVFLAGFNSLAA